MDDTTPKQQSPRKIIFIVIGILVCILFIIGTILFIRSKKSPAVDNGSNIGIPGGGETINNTNSNGQASEENQGGQAQQGKDIFTELYNGPLAGYTITEDGLHILGFDRSKGLIVSINTVSGEISNATNQPILLVHDALFLGENAVILRSLGSGNVIKSKLYNLNKNSGGEVLYQLNGPTNLPDNILELSKSPNNQKVLMVVKSENGGSIELFETESKKNSKIIELPLSEWIPQITDSGEMFLSAKASHFAKSGTYKINGGMLNTVSPASIGQTSLLSPDGSKIFTTSIESNGFSFIQDKVSNSNLDQAPELGFKTIADKCTWADDNGRVFCGVPIDRNTILDDWYLGKTRTSDLFYLGDTGGEKASLIGNPTASKLSLDAVKLSVVNNNLLYLNKKDEHLWSMKFEESKPKAIENTNTVSSTTEESGKTTTP